MVELFRDDPEEELGLRIVGGKDTPLGNIVIQEIVRDSVAARSGKLSPGDHVLEVRSHSGWNGLVFTSTESKAKVQGWVLSGKVHAESSRTLLLIKSSTLELVSN